MVDSGEASGIVRSVRDALAWAFRELSRTGVESPHLTAELLTAHVLQWDRVRVLSHGDERMPAAAEDVLRRMVRRRAEGVPLQYLTGTAQFFGRAFAVTPEVLIPRPETELLVETVVSAWSGRREESLRFIDVGCGSGCVAVSIAAELPAAVGWAIDVSAGALGVARQNARRHAVDGRLLFVQGDLLEPFRSRPQVDCIVSNPPYVSTAESASLPPVVREHEPHVALFAGADGMDVYARLVPQAAARLGAGGALVLEIGAGMSDAVVRLVEGEGLSVQSVIPDLQGIPRCVVARSTHG